MTASSNIQVTPRRFPAASFAKAFAFLLIFLASNLLCTVAHAQDYWLDNTAAIIQRNIETKANKLRTDIRLASSEEKKKQLREQLQMAYYDQAEEYTLLRENLDDLESRRIQSKENRLQKQRLIRSLTRNTFNRERYDEATTLAQQLLDLDDENGDDYFTARFYITMIKLKQSLYREAWTDLIDMTGRAFRSESKYGILLSYTLKSVAFVESAQNDSAIVQFKKGFELLEQDLYNIGAIKFCTIAALAAIEIENFDIAKEANTRLQDLVMHLNADNEFGISKPKFTWICNLISLAISIHEENLDDASACNDLLWGPSCSYIPDPSLLTSAIYYHALLCDLKGDYSQALQDINLVINQDNEKTPNFLYTKGLILDKSGDHEAACVEFANAAQLLNKRISQNFERELEQFVNATDTYNREDELQQLSLKKVSNTKVILLISVVVVIVLLIVLIIILYRNTGAARRLQQVHNQLIATSENLRLTNQQLSEAITEEEESYKKKLDFMGDISHEIRTPLNAILGFSEILQNSFDEKNSGIGGEYVSIIRSNSDMMLRLVNNVIETAKPQKSLVEIEIGTFDVIDCARTAFNNINVVIPDNVHARFVSSVEHLEIRTDHTRLQQILNNLLTNAAKFTKEGSITLSVATNDDFVIFTVTDTGCGIKPEDYDKLFTRTSFNTHLDDESNGLGLYISKLICSQLLGHIYLDESYTGGTRFIFEHPLRLDELKKEERRSDNDV